MTEPAATEATLAAIPPIIDGAAAGCPGGGAAARCAGGGAGARGGGGRAAGADDMPRDGAGLLPLSQQHDDQNNVVVHYANVAWGKRAVWQVRAPRD